MSVINVTNVEVLDNPTKFTNPFQFQITFECLAPGIKGELEWKLVYVGSAEDEKYDQELDCVLVGPVAIGKNKFVFQAPAPSPKLIPAKDLLEVTVILLTCSYNDHEFIRIGYYVNNDFGPEDPFKEQARELAAYNAATAKSAAASAADSSMSDAAASASATAPASATGAAAAGSAAAAPAPPVHPWAATAHQHIDQLYRNVLADKPRVTRFQIAWDNVATAAASASASGSSAAAAPVPAAATSSAVGAATRAPSASTVATGGMDTD